MPDQTQTIIDTFAAAAEANLNCASRVYQVEDLPEEGELWITGDLHDHRANYHLLVHSANLGANPGRHLLFQEIIHGDNYHHADGQSGELSWQILLEAAELKCRFPGQIHFILGNHDVAQLRGEGICKGGSSVVEEFWVGLTLAFGRESHAVSHALMAFLRSFPLAARTPSGVFCCHSIPSGHHVDDFDYGVFFRDLTEADFARRTGAAYQLVWGRNASASAAEKFADSVGASLLVTGHQPQDSGFAINGDRHIILASNHSQGVLLPVPLQVGADLAQAARWICPIIDLDTAAA